MARAWHLKSRPQGLPTTDNFELKPIELPPIEDDMVRVANRWLSVDPYMRGRMNDVKSYVPPFAIDAPMEGGAVGEVIESKASGLQSGRLGIDHFANRSALHRRVERERRHIAFDVVHAAAHVGVDRQPAVADPDHPVAERRLFKFLEVEVVGGWKPFRAALQMPGAGHCDFLSAHP